MNTTEDIIKIAKISQYLSQNDADENSLFGSYADPLLPQKIYNIRKSVEWANNNETLPSDATATITVNTQTNQSIFFNLFVKDPIIGVILLSSGNFYAGQPTVDMCIQFFNGFLGNEYGYEILEPSLEISTVTIIAPEGRGSSMNGISMYIIYDYPSPGLVSMTPFSGGASEVYLNVASTSNYLNALCGKYGLEAANLINQYGGLISSITYPMSVPTPIEFIVSSTSLIPTNSSSAVVNSFIGFNLLFIRNGISQSILNNGGSYFSWNKDTGVFICYPIASEGELFQLYPFI